MLKYKYLQLLRNSFVEHLCPGKNSKRYHFLTNSSIHYHSYNFNSCWLFDEHECKH